MRSGWLSTNSRSRSRSWFPPMTTLCLWGKLLSQVSWDGSSVNVPLFVRSPAWDVSVRNIRCCIMSVRNTDYPYRRLDLRRRRARNWWFSVIDSISDKQCLVSLEMAQRFILLERIPRQKCRARYWFHFRVGKVQEMIGCYISTVMCQVWKESFLRPETIETWHLAQRVIPRSVSP